MEENLMFFWRLGSFGAWSSWTTIDLVSPAFGLALCNSILRIWNSKSFFVQMSSFRTLDHVRQRLLFQENKFWNKVEWGHVNEQWLKFQIDEMEWRNAREIARETKSIVDELHATKELQHQKSIKFSSMKLPVFDGISHVLHGAYFFFSRPQINSKKSNQSLRTFPAGAGRRSPPKSNVWFFLNQHILGSSVRQFQRNFYDFYERTSQQQELNTSPTQRCLNGIARTYETR